MDDLPPPAAAAGWKYEEAAAEYVMTWPTSAISISVGRYALAHKVEVVILFEEDV